MLNQSSSRPDRLTLTAFIVIVLLGGSNSVAIRFSNLELPPFWGATLRFAFAGLILWLILWSRKLSLPSRRDSLIIATNGFFTVGASFALLYWGLLKAPVSLATVVIAMSPLLTFLLAVLHRTEVFRIQVLIGGVIALVGMAIAVNAQPGSEALIPSILALLAGALLAAEGNVIFKIYSVKGDSVVINALALSAGALFLILASLIAGETWRLPSSSSVWFALIYLILGGSVVMFYLFILVLKRWTASATSYAVLLFPIVATILATSITSERVTLMFVFGGLIVMLGVWIGAFYEKKQP